MAKTGVLLLNIGSPESYEVSDVKKYLGRFLMDGDVINLPWPLRFFLVRGIIVPRRSPYSAENYKKIWMEKEGSPLTVYTKKFASKLQNELGDDFLVKIGMRYSSPSTEQALKEFKESAVEKILVAPLYPQYADATTGSGLKDVQNWMQKLKVQIPLKVLPPFFDAAAFIQPTVQIIKDALEDKKPDHYLFSFHGLPESHVRRTPGCLQTDGCCFEQNSCAKNCYRAQCFESATRIAEELGLLDSHWSVSFQSRLGRGEWLKPSTDHTLEVLAQTGKKKVAVICPSFVADCIETLEEIGIGGQELFKEKGGEEFYLVPCLNEDSNWSAQFAALVKKQAHEHSSRPSPAETL